MTREEHLKIVVRAPLVGVCVPLVRGLLDSCPLLILLINENGGPSPGVSSLTYELLIVVQQLLSFYFNLNFCKFKLIYQEKKDKTLIAERPRPPT